MPDSTSTTAILSNVFLFFLVFGLSATVHIKSLKRQLQNWFALLIGIGMQFIIMPLLGFIVVIILKSSNDFTNAMGLSLLVVMASPGGTYSNLWCSAFNADLALSVTMTSVSTILSVALLPANLSLYTFLAYGGGGGGSSEMSQRNVVGAIDFGKVSISLGIVMGGIILGLILSYFIDSPVLKKWANRGASISGVALIIVSILLSSVGVDSSIWSQHWKFYVGVSVPCVLGLLLSNLIVRSIQLPKPECVAVSIECCYQNTGIATSVAVTMFSDPTLRAQAASVPLFYGFVEAAIISIYCLLVWKAGWTKAPADESLCVVLMKSYEVDDESSNIAPVEERS